MATRAKNLKNLVQPSQVKLLVGFQPNFTWGVRGRVVKVVDFKPLAPHHCGFESQQGLWILSYEEAIQLAY
jgi:hypothetical protein